MQRYLNGKEFYCEDNEIVVIDKKNRNDIIVLTVEELQESGIDCRTVDCMTVKQYEKSFDDLCTLPVYTPTGRHMLGFNSLSDFQGIFI